MSVKMWQEIDDELASFEPFPLSVLQRMSLKQVFISAKLGFFHDDRRV
jgi:hypothetical protein